MEKSEFAKYLRQRQLARNAELAREVGLEKKTFEWLVNSLSDQAIIDSYRICSRCGEELLTRNEMDRIIAMWDDPEKIFAEIPPGHE